VSTLSAGALSAGRVFNDAAADLLSGGLGDDWFFSSAGDTALDRLPTETATQV
jgi:hypothetical protein